MNQTPDKEHVVLYDKDGYPQEFPKGVQQDMLNTGCYGVHQHWHKETVQDAGQEQLNKRKK